MSFFNNSRKADRSSYNTSAEDFIPIACHYNENTLITKNGELIQIIQINGINSEKISDRLFNLRNVVRNAIQTHVDSANFMFWIHTVRRKTNLDDPAPYKKLLPANIHDLWRQKNYWDDKFVNTLYISIIYKAPDSRLKNFGAIVNSLFLKVISDFHDKYFQDAFQKLDATVSDILADLQEFGAVKLGIRFEGDKSFSDPMFLYSRIVHLSEDNCLVPIADLSVSLASHQYAVGWDKIEVIANEVKKFAAIISIKEYQEVSSDALDRFLQLPVELIATEIFYFVSKREVIPTFKEQDYILEVSKDSSLRDIKGLTHIMELSSSATNQFCNQQISITIIGDNLEKLDQDIRNASKELTKIGIVHVREDINLEQAFWAQLPGNLSYLRRVAPNILENTAALTSLHNSPTGSQYCPWGRAITLLRTGNGTPYFMNFHTIDDGAVTCIFGTKRTGKTVLTNFLISEATKFNPTILYLTDNNDSKIFIEAIEGSWLDQEKNIINPFLCEDTLANKDFINEFLKIICNHYIIPLTESELNFLPILTNKIFELDISARNLLSILKTIDFTDPGGDLIKARLAIFDVGGVYFGLFDGNNKFEFHEGSVIGINLFKLTEEYFTKQFFPAEKKLVDQFTTNLNIHNSIRLGLIYALTYYLTKYSPSAPKILALDNMNSLFNLNYYLLIEGIFKNLEQANGVVVSNFHLETLQSTDFASCQKWLQLINTKIILPSDVKIIDLDKILGLSRLEINKWSSLLLSSRMFLIKNKDQTITAELSIGGLRGIVKILSSQSLELKIYNKILQEYPGHPDNWVNPLYKALNQT